jgi:hypothetical protein
MRFYGDKAPRVTVLMPVFNGRKYLAESMDSVLRQAFNDFEFLIMDDGSTDGSADFVASYSDPRIRLERLQSNKGLPAVLNLGLDLARGDYVARMDSDDICLPHRLTRQILFMDAHPEIGISGAWMESFGHGRPSSVWQCPLEHEKIVCKLLFESALFHPTVIIRRSAFQNSGLFYDSHYPHAEDYELWSRCSNQIKFANLGEVLLRYRLHAQSVGCQHLEVKLHSAAQVRNSWLKQLGLEKRQGEIIHAALSLWEIEASLSFLSDSERWFLELIEANAGKQVFPEPFFSQTLAERWATICRLSTGAGPEAFQYYMNSILCDSGCLSKYEMFVFAFKSFLKLNAVGRGSRTKPGESGL